MLIWLDFHLNANSWSLAETMKSTEKTTAFCSQAISFWMVQFWVEYFTLLKTKSVGIQTTSTWTSCHLAENHAPNLHVFHRPCLHVSGWWWAPRGKVHRQVARWSSCRCPNVIADFPAEPPIGMRHKTAPFHSAMACYGYGKLYEIETAGIS